MGRKICVIILGLIFVGLAGEVRGQLPIYPDWEQTYDLQGLSRLVDTVLIASAVRYTYDDVEFPILVTVSSDSLIHEYPGWYYSMDKERFLVLASRDEIVWQRRWNSYGGLTAATPSRPIQFQSGNIALAAFRLRMTDALGEQLWNVGGTNGIYPEMLADYDQGVLAYFRAPYTYSRVDVVDLDGNIFRSFTRTQLPLFRLQVVGIPNKFLFVSGVDTVTRIEKVMLFDTTGAVHLNESFEYSVPVGICVEDRLLLFAIDTLAAQLVALQMDTTGTFSGETRFELSGLTNIGQACITTDNIVCLEYYSSDALGNEHHNMLFTSSQLDSLGNRTDAPAGSYGADNSGGLFVARRSGADFSVTRLSPTPTAARDIPEIPAEVHVSTYPNPFNASTTFSFDIPELTIVHLEVYDITGRLVTTLMDESAPAGSYTKTFDASNMASGVYIYSFRANDFTKHGKVLLLK